MAVNIRAPHGSNQTEVRSATNETDVAQPLIDRCVVGEKEAWRELHRVYYPTALRFLRRMGVVPAELDDACQEVFVQVFRYLPRFERRSDFQTWLYKLCISQATRVRRRASLQAALGFLLGHRPSAPSVPSEPEWSEAMVAERVRQTLDKMKPLHREVFVLYEIEGLDGGKVARILDCPQTTARRRLHYARREFESLLGQKVSSGEKS